MFILNTSPLGDSRPPSFGQEEIAPEEEKSGNATCPLDSIAGGDSAQAYEGRERIPGSHQAMPQIFVRASEQQSACTSGFRDPDGVPGIPAGLDGGEDMNLFLF
jgi:hypothetical protein